MLLTLPLTLLALAAAPAKAPPPAKPPAPAAAPRPAATCRALDGKGALLAEASSQVDFPDCLNALRLKVQAQCKGEKDLSFSADGFEGAVKADLRNLKVACGAPDSSPPPGFKKP